MYTNGNNPMGREILMMQERGNIIRYNQNPCGSEKEWNLMNKWSPGQVAHLVLASPFPLPQKTPPTPKHIQKG